MQAESGAAAAANGAAGCGGGSSPRCLPSWCCLGRGGFDQSPRLFLVLRRYVSVCREPHQRPRKARTKRGRGQVDVNDFDATNFLTLRGKNMHIKKYFKRFTN